MDPAPPRIAPAPAVPASEGVRAFARRLGCRPGYVTELRHAGRLVLTADGKHIRIGESLARIAATRDPTKAGVREYHQKRRQSRFAGQQGQGEWGSSVPRQEAATGAHSASGDASAMIPPPADIPANAPACPPAPAAAPALYSPTGPAETDADALPESEYALRRARALAAKEEALARKAQREEQLELGQLLDRGAVVSELAAAAVQLRQRLTQLPGMLAPQLAALDDEGQVRVQLHDAIETALNDLARAFSASVEKDTA